MPDSFILRLDDTSPSMSRLSIGVPAAAVQVAATDQLFVGDATGFSEFAISTIPLTYRWKSREYVYPKPENYSAGVIHALGVGVIRLYADGVMRDEIEFNDTMYFRLSSGPSAYRWSVELEGTAVVRKVDLGRSFAQLKGV